MVLFLKGLRPFRNNTSKEATFCTQISHDDELHDKLVTFIDYH